MENKTIAILGCGWFGLPMAAELIKNGYKVKGSTTTEAKLTILEKAGIMPYLIDFEGNSLSKNSEFFKCDVLLIAIPPKVKQTEGLSYAEKIKQVAEIALANDVKQVILISSTGIYADNNFIVDETVSPIPNTVAGEMLYEAETVLNSNSSFTRTIIRFAGLIGPGRNLAKHFAGKADIANGLAPINLIHLTDCIGLTSEIIEKGKFGNIYHGVSPSHPTRNDFYTQACIASGLEKPQFLNEKISWKQIESKNVPEVLAYEYVYADWNKYFKELAD